jgi:hypothetical protein
MHSGKPGPIEGFSLSIDCRKEDKMLRIMNHLLKKITFRKDSMRNAGDQEVILGRLCEQMLKYQTESQITGEKTPQEPSQHTGSKPSKASLTQQALIRFQPRTTS